MENLNTTFYNILFCIYINLSAPNPIIYHNKTPVHLCDDDYRKPVLGTPLN